MEQAIKQILKVELKKNINVWIPAGKWILTFLFCNSDFFTEYFHRFLKYCEILHDVKQGIN